MLWAKTKEGRSRASPGIHAVCPQCDADLIPKCGMIRVHHWAHKNADCDRWSEAESEWHIRWKQRFPDAWQEVIVGNHRADIKTPRLVIELQSSHLPPQQVIERESHYKNMIWVLNGHDFHKKLDITDEEGVLKFRWKHPRKSWWYAKRPIFIDMPGDLLIRVTRLDKKTPCYGQGYAMDKSEFVRKAMGVEKTKGHKMAAWIKNWFSNFTEFDEPMHYQGMTFPTVEHFFQAMKCTKDNIADRQKIANAAHPGTAKKLGKQVKLRPDWEDIKLKVMEYALRYKFAPGTTWHAKLMETEDDIIEHNNWHDNFWGRCNCQRCEIARLIKNAKFHNHLGKLLMKLRAEYREMQ